MQAPSLSLLCAFLGWLLLCSLGATQLSFRLVGEGNERLYYARQRYPKTSRQKNITFLFYFTHILLLCVSLLYVMCWPASEVGEHGTFKLNCYVFFGVCLYVLFVCISYIVLCTLPARKKICLSELVGNRRYKSKQNAQLFLTACSYLPVKQQHVHIAPCVVLF